MLSERRSKLLSAGVLATLFGLAGLVWITVTDYLAPKFPYRLPVELQTLKGALFVVVVSLFMYGLLRLHELREDARQRLFEHLFNQLPAAAWRTDLDSRLLWVAGGAVADLPPGLLPGRTVSDITRDPDHPAVAAHRRATEGQIINKYLLEFGGRTYSCSVVPLRSDGQIVGTLGAATDITEMLESRSVIASVSAKLNETESLWRAMVEQSLVGIYIIADERYLYVNPRARETLGYSMEELQALPSVLDVVAPEDRPTVAENMRRRKAGEPVPAQYTLKVLRKDGSTIDIELFSSAVKYQNRMALLGTFIEVTHRLDRERMQRQSELWFRTLIEASQDMVGVMDLEGRYLYVSPSVERVLGFRPEDLVGRSPLALIHEGDRPRIESEFRELVEGGQPLMTTFRFADASGQWHIVQASARMATNPDGQPIIIVNSADTTRMRKLERQYVEAERLGSLGRVASAMAHEFNNVLMAISPFAELLRKKATDEKLRSYAQRILTSIERGRNVTQDVLRYTRASRPIMQPVRAIDFFDGLRSELTGLLPSSIQLRMQVDPQVGLLADSNQLSQVVVNLALNARDAMPAGGTLSISALHAKASDLSRMMMDGDPSQYVHVVVADTGIGMSDEVMERMFEPMFTTRKASGGTGLGLSVVHEVIRSHGGYISAESVIGEGTTFHLFLPCAETSVPVTAPLKQPVGNVRIGGLLLVEDDDGVAEAVAASLREYGLHPSRVASAAEAIELTGREEFDVAIIDVGLPDLDGIRLARTLREIGHELSVVFVTGHADEREFQGRIAEHDVILHKPFESDDLVRALQRVTSRVAD